MNNLSFDIKTSRDFFKKLLEDYQIFCSDKTSSSVALNCVMTAWHLTEWVYNEFNQQLVFQFSTLSLYQQHMKQQCTSLQIMHDIANGTKHYLLTRHKPIVNQTILHKGAYSNAYTRAFDISTLKIELNNGTKIYFEDEIEKTVAFWTQYLKVTLNIII